MLLRVSCGEKAQRSILPYPPASAPGAWDPVSKVGRRDSMCRSVVSQVLSFLGRRYSRHTANHSPESSGLGSASRLFPMLMLSHSSYLQASLPFVGPQSFHSPINSSILSHSPLPLPLPPLVIQGAPGCSLHVLNSFTQLGLCLCCWPSSGMAIFLSYLLCQLKDPPNYHVLHINFLDFPV